MAQKFKKFMDFENGLKAAYDNYKKWQDDPDLHSLGKPYKKRPPQTELFVNMFATAGVAAAANVFYASGAQSAAWTTYKPKFTGYTKETVPATGLTLELPRGARIARFSIKSGVLSAPVDKSSHITKRKYKSYGGESVSIPFGAKTATETIAEAYIAIKGSITIAAGTKVTLLPEKYNAA